MNRSLRIDPKNQMVLVTLLALALGVATTVAAEGGGLLPVPPCSSLLL
eukprot:COSAG02_NODE_47904_length_337_cov_51.193277_1_plen_47_part_10